MAAANSKKPAAVAAADDAAPAWISVQTRDGEMWRCARKWGVEPQTVSVADLGEEAVERLRAEPRLIVRDVPAPDAA